MPELNDPQRDAVLHITGPLLVFAGAGSGKTRVITYRIANLLSEHRVAPYRILAVTFTNKAAGEMKARLVALAGEGIVHDLCVGTFHAVCARLLRRYHAEVGLERKFVIYDDSDQKALLGRIIKARGLDDRVYPPKRVLGAIMARKREAIAPGEVELTPSFDDTMVDLYRGYETALKTVNAVDFEDLILHVMRIAESRAPAGAELRDKFSHVLVDEFKDTNAVQYRLVRALAAREQNLCVVGDDDQSIYSWRGADIRNIRGFERDFPGAQIVKLEQNYRSSGNIVAAALGVIQEAKNRADKRLWTDAEAGDPVRIHAVRDERDEAATVVESIQRELARGTPRSEIAIFYRVNAQSRVLEEALRSEHIPYQIIGGMKFFERAEVKNLLSYLRLLENPRSDADLLRVINVPTRGIGDKTVNRLLQIALNRDTSAYDAIDAAVADAQVGTAGKKKLKAFQALIEELRALSERTGPHDLAEAILEQTGYRKLLRADDTAESDARLENLAEMLGSLREYEEDTVQAGEPATLEGYLERVALAADIDGMNEEECVVMMTVHSAKGLEFECVFLTGMEEEVFPYRGLDGESPEELEEERRLAYVAITRARKRLSISYAGVRTIFGQTRYLAPSRFLTDVPDSVATKTGGGWNPWKSAPPSAAYSASRGDRYGYGASSARRGSSGGSSASSAARGSSASAASRGSLGPMALKSREAPAPLPDERVVEYDVPDAVEQDAHADAFDDSEHSGPIHVRRGARVVHQRFGTGIVENVEPGSPPRVIARFPGFGSRKVLPAYLRFE